MDQTMLLNLPLPQHITLEILLQLPFDTILTCKLVSKQLKIFINHPNFYKLYNNRNVAFYFGREGLYCLLISHSVNTNNDVEFPPYTVHHVPIGLNKDSSNVGFLDFEVLSCSSNVIACVKPRYENYFLFYNLFTGDSYSVEGSPKEEEEILVPFWICYGFGYDCYADDYKIFEVFKYMDKNDVTKITNIGDYNGVGLFWVYSFKNRGWKSFRGYPFALYDGPRWGAAYSLNGVLHWVVVAIREKRKRVVLTFDLHACKFGEILLPVAASDVVPSDEFGTAKESELEGMLCFVFQREMNFCVWVMQEYGVRESWTKLLYIEDVKCRFNGTRFGQATPVVLYEREGGGKVLLFALHIGVKLFWYDMDKKVIKVVDETISRRRDKKQRMCKL